MKKLLFLPLLIGNTFLLTACNNSPTTQPIQEVVAQPDRTGDYAYTFQMMKPELNESTNRETIFSGFYQEWETGHVLTKEEVEIFNENCVESEWDKPSLIAEVIGEGKIFSKEISKDQVKVGNSITLTGYYQADPLLTIVDKQLDTTKKQLQEKGRATLPIAILNKYIPTNYERETGIYGGFEEERTKHTYDIAGRGEPSERYPFNTLLITNDLLLHVYHKIFDNSLKYYEEHTARPTLEKLSLNLRNQYLTLAKKEKNADLKAMYDFLAAYWTVPSIFLPSEDSIRTTIEKIREKNDQRGKSDLNDEEIGTIIKERTKELTKELFPTYQNLLPKVVDQILAAEEDRALDTFMISLGKDFFQQADMEIQQDYTQFQPRSHYTDSSLLKTYFIATKWLMREKFYFGSPELTRAAMIMASTISEDNLKEFNKLSEQIKNLIGSDDDLTIQEMRDFLRTEKLNTPNAILSNAVTSETFKKLKTLHPQRITSTHYQTAEVGQTTEQEAKETLDGFIFFGEKFTLDSFIFDQMTAGSAEKEFTTKPNMQTALIIPDILANNDLAHQLVKIRMTEKSKLSPPKILENQEKGYTQLSSYDQYKTETQEIIKELSTTDVINNIYHKRLGVIAKLLDAPLENAPYFRLDPLYQMKNLVTYLGSYTELKHDTLLYVKQAYAEMGEGGPNSCAILIDPPALPVPKGYIEAEPEFLDSLIALTEDTIKYTKGSDSFQNANLLEFATALKKLKEISIKQMHNEVISDEDFEWMRVDLVNLFRQIVLPTKTFGEATQQEMRGAIIADIFTSENDGPLYEAVGRPALMLLNVSDTNGTRTVIGPIFTHYEFYASDEIIKDATGGRYTDQDRQAQLFLEEENQQKKSEQRSISALSLPSKQLESQ